MARDKKGGETGDTRTSQISEIAKKVFLTGLGAIFMTEESVRNLFTDLKLPKEAVSYVLEQAKKQKDDLVAAVANEIAKFLSKVKVQEEVQKALHSLQVHVEAKVTFSPRSRGDQPFLKIKIEE